MAMTGFFFQDKYLDRLAKLSDQEVGRLVRALAQYHATGEEQELKGRECGYYDFIKADIDENEKAYQKKCETNRANRQRTPTSINEINQPLTTVDDRAQNINIKEKEKDKNKDIPLKPPKGGGVAFEAFWVAYPRHTNKQAALKAFLRLNPDDVLMQTILKAISIQRQSDQWTRDGWQYIPHPATWLNGRRWEDEMPKGGKTVAAQRYQQRYYTEEELDSLSEDLLEEARKAKDDNLLEEAGVAGA